MSVYVCAVCVCSGLIDASAERPEKNMNGGGERAARNLGGGDAMMPKGALCCLCSCVCCCRAVGRK